MTDSFSERRGATRVPYAASAVVFVGSDQHLCAVRNVSAGGMLVRAEAPIATGQYVRVNVDLPGLDEVLDLDAIVVRATEEGGCHAVALQFQQVPPRTETLLRTYVSWVLIQQQAREQPATGRPAPAKPAPAKLTPAKPAPAKPRPGKPAHVRPATAKPTAGRAKGAAVDRATARRTQDARATTGPAHPAVRGGSSARATPPRRREERPRPPRSAERGSAAERKPTGEAFEAVKAHLARRSSPSIEEISGEAELVALRSLYSAAVDELGEGARSPTGVQRSVRDTLKKLFRKG